jgi:hypothetical protein
MEGEKLMGYKCDRCGQEMNDWWEIEGMPGVGGNCEICGDNLCAKCADWNHRIADGVCGKCRGDGSIYAIIAETIVNRLYSISGIKEEDYRKFYYKGKEAVREGIHRLLDEARSEIRNEIIEAFSLFTLNLESYKINGKSQKERLDYIAGFNAFHTEYTNRLNNLATVIDYIIEKALAKVAGNKP